MSYSNNKSAAFKFLDFMTTTKAANIINAAGLIPDITGTTTSNSVNQQMLNFVTKSTHDGVPDDRQLTQVNVGQRRQHGLAVGAHDQATPMSALRTLGVGSLADSGELQRGTHSRRINRRAGGRGRAGCRPLREHDKK